MESNLRFELPEAVRFIIDRLNRHGHEAYVVGGCVRDLLLGLEPHDWDITTSAMPQTVKALFKRTIDTGIIHGTVTIMEQHVGYEVTTYRTGVRFEEREVLQKTQFADNLREDLAHRDFTINAMAYNPKEGLVDLFGGVNDLEKRKIVCVEKAADRFHEDPLRILRAVRFGAKLGFTLDEEIRELIPLMAEDLRKVSPERIHDELVKLFVSERPEYFRLLFETGITKVILPEFDQAYPVAQNCKYHCYNVGEHTLAVLLAVRDLSAEMETERKLPLRLAAVFHDLGKAKTKTTDASGTDHFRGHQTVSMEMAKEILTRLRFDNKTLERTCKLICFHDHYLEPDEVSIRQGIALVGTDYIRDILLFERADAAGKCAKTRDDFWHTMDEIEPLLERILERGDCVTLKQLAVTGKDMIEAGVSQGPAIGETLNRLLAHVLIHPSDNTKDRLLELIEK